MYFICNYSTHKMNSMILTKKHIKNVYMNTIQIRSGGNKVLASLSLRKNVYPPLLVTLLPCIVVSVYKTGRYSFLSRVAGWISGIWPDIRYSIRPNTKPGYLLAGLPVNLVSSPTLTLPFIVISVYVPPQLIWLSRQYSDYAPSNITFPIF